MDFKGSAFAKVDGVTLEADRLLKASGARLVVVLLGGGAINAAKGSLFVVSSSFFSSVTTVASAGLTGGGANGFDTSLGSSPGNIHRPSFLS